MATYSGRKVGALLLPSAQKAVCTMQVTTDMGMRRAGPLYNAAKTAFLDQMSAHTQALLAAAQWSENAGGSGCGSKPDGCPIRQ